MTHLWQHPYVNVFKHFGVETWKKSTKEGEVTQIMDKTIKGSVFKIVGSIPAGNYIQLPKTATQSLGLTGHLLYLCFRPVPSKYFVVHIDVVTQDGLVVRVSFSNLFKEFKSTSTWLQFPYICQAAHASISDYTAANSQEHAGAAPLCTKWTLLCLDMQHILSLYLNRRYSYVKSIRLCANMLVRNVITSDTEFMPGLSFDELRRSGQEIAGQAPIPREFAFPVGKDESWSSLYDYIRFPCEGSKKPFDSIQHEKNRQPFDKSGLTSIPRRIESQKIYATNSTDIDQLTKIAKGRQVRLATQELPTVGHVSQASDGDVHIYATTHNRHVPKRPAANLLNSDNGQKDDKCKTLTPDPILQLRRIVGFGGATTSDVMWTSSGTAVVYPCHAVVVVMDVTNGHQRFFIGHTDKVSCISMNGVSSLLASGQTGQQSVVRVWAFQNRQCLAVFKAHDNSLHSLSMSHSGRILCGVGKDVHGKTMVVVWSLERVESSGTVTVISKAHTDVDIGRMRIALFDDTRMVSCGRDNIRLWRVKDGQLRSAPVNLGDYHSAEFTDCCFEAGHKSNKDPLDRTVYACTRAGHIFEVDYRKVKISKVRRLLPTVAADKDKQTFNAANGIAINSMCVSDGYCVTGSDDGYVRLWPLDFQHVFVEAEHEGAVTGVDISPDGVRVLTGTCTGNLGILDISERQYTTLMRSHSASILCMSVDSLRRHIATVSEDHTIRVWDVDTLQQLYDFTAPKECPTVICYHPKRQVLACGFDSGLVRVFDVCNAAMIAEHRQHQGRVKGLAYCPTGDYMYSAGVMGSLALYHSADKYQLLRLLGNTVVLGDRNGPNAISCSPDGLFVAFVGPNEFTVSVVDSRTLDEMLRIDITSVASVDGGRSGVDSAEQVKFSVGNVRHLLVTTANNRLLKFDSRNGKLLAELNNIQRRGCTDLDVAPDGRHLATAGDKVIKVWDYDMKIGLNFQVFIGHAEPINQLVFTTDYLSLISIGEAIFLWDFVAHKKDQTELEGRTSVTSYITGKEEQYEPFRLQASGKRMVEEPRHDLPEPLSFSAPPTSDISAIDRLTDGDLFGEDVLSETSEKEVDCRKELSTDDEEEVSVERDLQEKLTVRGSAAHSNGNQPAGDNEQPRVYKHFTAREKASHLAQRRYVVPPSQAGIALKAVVGYNGNGRNNMIWNADTGLLIYTSGCIVIVEDLEAGSQRHLLGHSEEISTVALQNDCQMLASASAACADVPSQIIVWDLKQMASHKVLTFHDNNVICLAYSRDDRFLLSLGDYRDRTLVVWSTYNYGVLVTTRTSVPMHELRWDPFTVNEFVSVGANGSILFWLLDETGGKFALNVHEGIVPAELLQLHHVGSTETEFTSVEYTSDSTLYVATNTGIVAAWDTRHNTCFMHWQADQQEIGLLVCKGARLITGSRERRVCLWSAVGVSEMKLPGQHNNMRTGGLTIDDEMILDGAITAGCFDDTLDMGIVATSAGTLWYINWPERSSVRLVSGHCEAINAIAFSGDYVATCSEDGSLRVWSNSDWEQTVQFQVVEKSCTCLSFSPVNTTPVKSVSSVGTAVAVMSHVVEDKRQLPAVVAGYSDGAVRMFDLNHVDMMLKIHPHSAAVTALCFSADGRMIVSGTSDGLLAVSSATTGLTTRIISDHKGAPITCIDTAPTQSQDGSTTVAQLWLAVSADRRVSIWSADWSRDVCELVDWLTFPAPAFVCEDMALKPEEKDYYKRVPASIARFSLSEPDIVVYTGYGMHKMIQFYSLAQKKVVRTIALTHWATDLDLSPNGLMIATGNKERLVKLLDYQESSFQDFTGHSDTVSITRFSCDGSILATASHNELLLWTVNI